MLKKIQERILPIIIALSAISVSTSAAFYSVSGLSKLFAGAFIPVVIMASSLEFAKLVIASLLYQYRKTLPLPLKIYLSIACFVLILITSMGIYGFLSASYQETANKSLNIDSQISLIETRRDNTKSQLNVYNTEKQLTLDISANVVTALTLEALATGFRISPDMASIDFTETATRSRENNSIFYASTCAITLKDDTQTTRDFVALISGGFITIIQEKENGTNLIYGSGNGMTVDTSAITTGMNYEDLNGVVISLVGKETYIAPSISDVLISGVL
jgi:hypothetical protein